MTVSTVNTILASKEAYLYLQNRFKQNRCGKTFSEKGVERLTENFNRFQNKGFIELRDYNLQWSCKEMKLILDEKGLLYKDGEKTEVIS